MSSSIYHGFTPRTAKPKKIVNKAVRKAIAQAITESVKAPEPEPAKDEIETYSILVDGGQIQSKELAKICKNVSAKSEGKQDFIIFRGKSIVAIPAAIVKPLVRLFQEFVFFDVEPDRVIFREANSKTVVKSIPFDKVGKLIAVDVLSF